MTITLIGAYGQFYRTMDIMLKAWYAGKDFKIVNGPYCSIRDIDYMVQRHDKVELRADNGTRFTLAQSPVVDDYLKGIL
jgi:hypothetical protein